MNTCKYMIDRTAITLSRQDGACAIDQAWDRAMFTGLGEAPGMIRISYWAGGDILDTKQVSMDTARAAYAQAGNALGGRAALKVQVMEGGEWRELPVAGSATGIKIGSRVQVVQASGPAAKPRIGTTGEVKALHTSAAGKPAAYVINLSEPGWCTDGMDGTWMHVEDLALATE